VEQQSEPFDLRRFARVIRIRWPWVVTPAVLAVAVVVSLDLARKPQYDSTVVLLAGQGEGIAEIAAIDAITKATQTLSRMSTNLVVIEKALDDLKLKGDLDASDIAQRTRSSVPANTQQIEITVRDSSAPRAMELANGIGQAFSDMVEKRASANSNLSASVWQPAVQAEEPATPQIPRDIALAVLAGLFLGVAIALVREHLDTSWNGPEELEDFMGIPVLASIPEMKNRAARSQVRV